MASKRAECNCGMRAVGLSRKGRMGGGACLTVISKFSRKILQSRVGCHLSQGFVLNSLKGPIVHDGINPWRRFSGVVAAMLTCCRLLLIILSLLIVAVVCCRWHHLTAEWIIGIQSIFFVFPSEFECNLFRGALCLFRPLICPNTLFPSQTTTPFRIAMCQSQEILLLLLLHFFHQHVRSFDCHYHFYHY